MTETRLHHYPRCFGCGEANRSGLHLDGTWNGQRALIHHDPPLDAEGGPGVVHGGYLSALVDEAMALTASASAGSPAMTRRIELDFHAPTLVQRTLTIQTWVEQNRRTALIVRLEARQGNPGTVCFQAKGVYIKVPATVWADHMVATDRTSERLDFTGGDPSAYFRWQLDGFLSVYNPARLKMPVEVLLEIRDVSPSQWTLSATRNGLSAREGHTDAGAPKLISDFSTWQRLTHRRSLSLHDAISNSNASVDGDIEAVEILLDMLQQEL